MCVGTDIRKFVSGNTMTVGEKFRWDDRGQGRAKKKIKIQNKSLNRVRHGRCERTDLHPPAPACTVNRRRPSAAGFIILAGALSKSRRRGDDRFRLFLLFIIDH